MAFSHILSTLTFTGYPTIRHIPVTDAASVVKHSTNNGDVHGSESFPVMNSDHSYCLCSYKSHTAENNPSCQTSLLRLHLALCILPRQGNKT